MILIKFKNLQIFRIVPEGPAPHQGDLREARRALRSGVCLEAPRAARGRHGWQEEHARVGARRLRDTVDVRHIIVFFIVSGDGDDESRMRRGDGAVAEGLSRQSWLTS